MREGYSVRRVTTQLGVPLREYTTLRLGGPAGRLLTASSAAEVVEAFAGLEGPVLLLGGGSNLVIADDGFSGTVVRVASRGFSVSPDAILTVEAGEDWDAVVARAVDEGYGGLECLSGIPGLVGATPVQNVGAYGVEISDLLVDVDLLDRASGLVRAAVGPAELGLGYRTSTLKNTDVAVVLRVRLALNADGLSAPVRYAELARGLGVPIGSRLPPAEVRAAVLELRRGKGMVLDPTDHDTWSAGSFFTNPIVAVDAVPSGDMPRWPAGDGLVKLSAAWLIEHAGFHRGHPGPGGRVALSTKHTLALTNRGTATTADLLALAREVVQGVRSRFGITLHPEPVLVNCAL
jgi:UDP-N-acetylmuramate dehydrogenase